MKGVFQHFNTILGGNVKMKIGIGFFEIYLDFR